MIQSGTSEGMGHIANLILDSSVGVVASVYLPPANPLPNIATDFSQTGDFSSTNDPKSTTEPYFWRLHNSIKNKPIINQHHKEDDLQIKSREGQKPEDIAPISPSPSLFQSKLVSLDRVRPASTLSNALRMKLKEPILNRRRKKSVPEIGPMTTVQELAMDSPTIPGRPPVHERSHSVPVSTCRQKLGESAKSFLSGPVPDEKAEIVELQISITEDQEESLETSTESVPLKIAPDPQIPTQPTTITQLTSTEQSNLVQQSSHCPALEKLSPKVISSNDSHPPEVPPKEIKVHQESPCNVPKSLPLIPISSWSSAFSATFSGSSPTISPLSEGRSSPKPWSFGLSSSKTWSITSRSSPKSSPTSSTSSLRLHSQKSETSLISEASKVVIKKGHSRHSSEDNTGLKSDTRGRSIQRSHPNIMSKENQVNDPPLDPISTSPLDDRNRDLANSPCSLPEPQCFLSLPTGYSPSSASQNFSSTELSYLQNQALSQAFRFKVLPSRDVASLSRELRALDERCEFLRKTHHSLRNDRQLLHTRICSNLRNSRFGRFSCDTILKLEVNLSEKDRCIDACVSKYELAENRRMRVRQKLLEHVAAAAIVEVQSPAVYKMQQSKFTPSEITGESTPPRSPQHFPEQIELVIKGIPSNLEPPSSVVPEPLVSHTPRTRESFPESPHEKLSDKMSEKNNLNLDTHLASLIQPQHEAYIYTDKDVFELMDCVEEEMERMGM